MNWNEMFFQDWEAIVRTVIVGLLAYAAFCVVRSRYDRAT